MIDSTGVIPFISFTADGHEFGYIPAGGGGFFFTWWYGADRTPDQRIDQICNTIEADSVYPPTGRRDLRRQAEKALRAYINAAGIRKIPAYYR